MSRVSVFINSALLVLISGCGGSSEDMGTSQVVQDDSQQTTEETTNATIAIEEDETSSETLRSIEELIIPDDFRFSTSRKVSLEVSVSRFEEKRAFLSVYSRYSELESGLMIPDYDSLLLRDELIGGSINDSLTVTNDIDNLLLQIWSTDMSDEPLVAVKAIKKTQTINLSF